MSTFITFVLFFNYDYDYYLNKVIKYLCHHIYKQLFT